MRIKFIKKESGYIIYYISKIGCLWSLSTPYLSHLIIRSVAMLIPSLIRSHKINSKTK
jgi:hypothetical protein